MARSRPRMVACLALLFAVLVAPSRARGQDAAPPPGGETRAHPFNYVGLRLDGSGLFPDATPVLEWDERTGKNILWRAPLPSWSASSPIVVGDTVLTLAEPNLLLAFDAATGRPQWQQEVDHSELLPPDEAPKTRALYEKWAAEVRRVMSAFTELQCLWNVLGALDGKPADTLFKGNFAWSGDASLKDELLRRLRGLPPQEVETLRARRAALEQERPSWGKEPNHFGVGFRGGAALEEWRQAQKDLARHGYLFETWYGYIGQTFATPVSDGEGVFVSMGWGQVACYELDGRRRWLKWFEPRNGSRLLYTNSPVLAGERLIVIAGGIVRALDKHTGQESWAQPYKTAGQNHAGAPVCLRLQGVDVLVTSHGRIYRIADGKVVAAGLPEQVSMPALHGDWAYFNTGIVHGTEGKLEAIAFRLRWAGPDQVEAAKAWSTPLPGRAGMWVGPAYFQGHLYYSYPQVVTVLDATTGEVVAKHVPNEFNFGGSHAPNTVVAGGHVFAGNCYGRTLVIAPGPQGKPRFCNTLASELHRDHVLLTAAELKTKYWDKDLFPTYGFTASTPFFAKDRTYIRSYEALYCIGTKH